MEWLLFELKAVLLVNLLAWSVLLILPPVVILVEEIKLLHLRPQGMAVFFCIIIKRSSYSDAVVRHELEHLRQMRLFSPIGLAVFILFHYGYLYLRYRSFAMVYSQSLLEKWANDKMYNTAHPLPSNLIILNRDKKA